MSGLSNFLDNVYGEDDEPAATGVTDPDDQRSTSSLDDVRDSMEALLAETASTLAGESDDPHADADPADEPAELVADAAVEPLPADDDWFAAIDASPAAPVEVDIPQNAATGPAVSDVDELTSDTTFVTDDDTDVDASNESTPMAEPPAHFLDNVADAESTDWFDEIEDIADDDAEDLDPPADTDTGFASVAPAEPDALVTLDDFEVADTDPSSSTPAAADEQAHEWMDDILGAPTEAPADPLAVTAKANPPADWTPPTQDDAPVEMTAPGEPADAPLEGLAPPTLDVPETFDPPIEPPAPDTRVDAVPAPATLPPPPNPTDVDQAPTMPVVAPRVERPAQWSLANDDIIPGKRSATTALETFESYDPGHADGQQAAPARESRSNNRRGPRKGRRQNDELDAATAVDAESDAPQKAKRGTRRSRRRRTDPAELASDVDVDNAWPEPVDALQIAGDAALTDLPAPDAFGPQADLPAPTDDASPLDLPAPTADAAPLDLPAPTADAAPLDFPVPTEDAAPFGFPTPDDTAVPIDLPLPADLPMPSGEPIGLDAPPTGAPEPLGFEPPAAAPIDLPPPTEPAVVFETAGEVPAFAPPSAADAAPDSVWAAPDADHGAGGLANADADWDPAVNEEPKRRGRLFKRR